MTQIILYQQVNKNMGGGSSVQKNQIQYQAKALEGLVLVGSTSKGPLAINFQPQHIQSTKCTFRIPKYAQTVLKNASVAYLTGGVQQLQSTTLQLTSPGEQEYEGVISKCFIQIKLNLLFKESGDAFQLLPEMKNARYNHSAVMFSNALYICGGRQYGDDETGILSACEKFQFTTNKWKTLPNMMYPRSGGTAIVYGEHIYVFGGYSGKGQRTRVIESYHEGDSSWRKLPYKLHEGIEGFLTIQSSPGSSSVYIFGGKTDDGKKKSVTQLNLDKSSVQYMKPMKEVRSYLKGYLVGKVVHLLGGGTQTIQSYDLTQNVSAINKQLSFLQHCSSKDFNSLSSIQQSITLKYKKKPYQSPSYPYKVFIFGHAKQPFAKIIDMDKLVVISENQNLNHNFFLFPTVVRVNKQTNFVMGGINSEFTQVTDTVYSFNLQTQQIKYLQSMSQPKYGFSSIVKGSYLYIMGGRKLGGDQVAILGTCQRFSFQTYQWETIASLKHKRHSSLAAAVGDHLLVIGGYKGQGMRSADIELYVEEQNRWVQVQDKLQLAAQSMTSVSYEHSLFIFGGRAQQIDIQKVFRLNIQIDEGIKYEKSVKTSLEPVGNLSVPGTNLRVFVNAKKGLAYVFGNVKHGIDVYDLKAQKIVNLEKLPVFQHLEDELFQSYAILF